MVLSPDSRTRPDDPARPPKGRPDIRNLLRFTLVLAAVGLCVPAGAATWHVPYECPTIQAGIDSAAVGDTVLVACGTYLEHDIAMKSGVCLTSETGEADCVTIHAQQMGRGILCQNVDSAASIVGFTLTGGMAVYGTATQDSAGGGISCEESFLTIANCAFVDNYAGYVAGGLFCGTDRSFELRSGKLRHEGTPALLDRGGPTVVDCTFTGNSAKGGGAVSNYQCAPSFTRCTFSGNTAKRGGAMYVAHDGTSVVDCTFFGNQADISAGAMDISAWSGATITDCEFLHNTSAQHAGAVRSEQYSVPVFTNVSFTRNVAVWSGGAVLCEDGTAQFDHVEFASNTAGGAGGGMRISLSASTFLTNVTFFDNTGANGTGLYVSDGTSATLDNCIVAFGSDASSGIKCASTGDIDLTACNVYGNGGGDWVDCIAGQASSNGNFSEDPLFCEADLGDLTLHQDSPCLPMNHPQGGDWGLIGAWDLGCSATGIGKSVEEASWGAIKAMYR
jgi:predicted outer membrane repeat protein